MKVRRNTLRQIIDTDTIFSAVITVFFLVLFCATFGMQELSTYLLPRVLAAIGAVMGIIALLVKFVRSSSRDNQDTEADTEDYSSEGKGLAASYTMLLTVVYFFLVKYLGFILTTFIAIVAFSILLRLHNLNKVVVVIIAIVVPVVLHSLFVTLLKVNLPEGILSSVLPF